MSLKNYHKFLESIKDDLTPLQTKLVKQKWGSKYLDYEEPTKNNLLPEGKWILSKEDRERVLNTVFKTDIEWIKTYLSSFSDKFITVLKQSILDSKLKSSFDIKSLTELDYNKLEVLYGNNFRTLSPKETESDRKILKDDKGKPILGEDKKPQFIYKEKGQAVFTNNLSNINTFIDSWNKSYVDEKMESEFDNKNFTTIKSFFENEDDSKLLDFNIFNDKDIYLLITSKPSETLNMSASKFFTSCQDIYRDTGYDESVLSNVFDQNSKMCFIIYDTPYYKGKELISKIMPICRSVMRVVEATGSLGVGDEKNETYLDKCYPYRMEDTLSLMVNNYTGLHPLSKGKVTYNYSPDIDWYDEISMPYQDTINSIKKIKVIGKNTKYIKYDFDLVDLIQSNKLSVSDDNNVIKLNVDLFEHDLLEQTVNGKYYNQLFPKLKMIEWNKVKYSSEIDSITLLTYHNTICLSSSKINNMFWEDLFEEKIYGIELTNTIDSDNQKNMPDISKLSELIEVNLFYTYRILSQSLLNLKDLKILRISRNIERYNLELLNELKKKGVKIIMIGL